MKKSYLILAAVAGLFASCAQNEEIVQVVDEPVAIGFGSEFVDNVTRAELTLGWFQTLNNAFGVYGFKDDSPIFTNENVYCSDDASPYEWSHATVRFWDKGANDAYDFYAYAPFTGTNNTAGTNPTFAKSTGFTFTAIPTIVDITTAGADKAVATAVENIDYADGRLHGTVASPVHANSPTVQFTFNHILSKLSFKVMTDVAAHNAASNPVASFTVTSIVIDFPSSTAGAQWAQGASNDIAGSVTYPSNDYTAKDGTFETTVFSGSQAVTNSALEIGNTYIVVPAVNSSTSHVFDVKVTYNILYADNTTETGCVATGTIGNGTPATNTYAPAQNQYWIATIKIDPAQINFCVESVNTWDPVTNADPVVVN